MSSIYAPQLAESTSMNEGEGGALKGDQTMLQPAAGDDMAAWTHGRGDMSHHDHFIRKQLLLFDPLPLSHYSCPIFIRQHQDQDQVSAEHNARGLNDPKVYDHGVIPDDPHLSKQHVINDHDQFRDHNHIEEGHDHAHHYGRHRHTHRDQQRFYRECNNSNNQLRTCVDCNTTKTPLWRSGPLGPKSLCNACGIRHHKARRARAAAAAAGENCCLSPIKSKHKKEKRADSKPNSHYKRKNKIFASPRGRKKICLDLDLNCEVRDDDALQYTAETTETTLDLSMELNESKPFTRVFPKDEEQAAILLMALSCGLVHG